MGVINAAYALLAERADSVDRDNAMAGETSHAREELDDNLDRSPYVREFSLADFAREHGLSG